LQPRLGGPLFRALAQRVRRQLITHHSSGPTRWMGVLRDKGWPAWGSARTRARRLEKLTLNTVI